MDAGTYISERVAALRNRSQEFYDLDPDTTNDFDSWSALKLILHSAAINMYTSVHQRRTGDIFYIDALAGSGVSTYESNRCFVGSPLIAARDAETPFKKMYFIESNEDFCIALENRLEYAFKLPEYTEPEEFEVIPGNANEEIDDVINEIREIGDFEDRFNYYCFIDNQGLDVNWSSIEDLTPKPYGDLLINLPIAHAIGRNASIENIDSLNEFYGTDMEEFALRKTTREELKSEYYSRLAARNREIWESTQIQTNIGSFYYDLVYATRKTGGDNGYMRVIRYVKNFIESVHSGDVDHILEVVDGPQETIDAHLPEEDIEEELPEDDDDQSDLGEFL